MQRDEILAVLRSHWNVFSSYGVRELALFGSFARNEARPESDVDLLVAFERPIGLFTFAELQLRLQDVLGRSVDLVTEQGLHPALRDRVTREALRV